MVQCFLQLQAGQAGLWQGRAGGMLRKEHDSFIHEHIPSFARSQGLQHTAGKNSSQQTDKMIKTTRSGGSPGSIFSSPGRLHSLAQRQLRCCFIDSPCECCCFSICTGFEDLQVPAKPQTWNPSKRYLGQYPSATEPATGI